MEKVNEKKKLIPPDNLGTKFRVEEVERFVTDCLVQVGAAQDKAAIQARVLVAADLQGHYTHGLYRLDMYVSRILGGLVDPKAEPTVVRESGATAFVDGNNAIGPVVGDFCMRLAMKKARETGIGMVSCRGSNHYGIAGWYSMMAAEEGLVGLSFTNTAPIMTSDRGKTRFLGTNPVSLAAQSSGDDRFMLDMATTVVSAGKVKLATMKGEPVPEGWGTDRAGAPTTDPTEVLQSGCLLPLGSTDTHSAYKGFGLAMMVELLCGVLSGGDYGPKVRGPTQRDAPHNISHCMIAFDPACFAPGFHDRLHDFLQLARSQEPKEEGRPVVVAGDLERKHEHAVKAAGGLSYHPNQAKEAWQLAKYLGVEPLRAID